MNQTIKCYRSCREDSPGFIAVIDDQRGLRFTTLPPTDLLAEAISKFGHAELFSPRLAKIFQGFYNGDGSETVLQFYKISGGSVGAMIYNDDITPSQGCLAIDLNRGNALCVILDNGPTFNGYYLDHNSHILEKFKVVGKIYPEPVWNERTLISILQSASDALSSAEKFQSINIQVVKDG